MNWFKETWWIIKQLFTYEMEAYANDDNFDYLKTRKPEDLDKYKIKDRKKTYKANKKNWRQYLKTIK